jgi:hypothetical protein
MFFGADFLPMQEIRFADHADHIFVVVDDGERADVMLGEQPHRFGNRVVRLHRDDVADHDVQRFHACLPPLGVFAGIAPRKGSLSYRRVTAYSLL